MSKTFKSDLNECATQEFNELLDVPLELLSGQLKVSLLKFSGQCFQLDNFITHGGLPDIHSLSISILKVDRQDKTIKAKLGLFFNEEIGGCNCSDAPHIEINYHEVVSIIEDTKISILRE